MKIRPLVFLDIDDVIAINIDYTGADVVKAFKNRIEAPEAELWRHLFSPEACSNLDALHAEFWPQYVITSTWATYLTLAQLRKVFDVTGLSFVSKNLHKDWTSARELGKSRLNEISVWLAKNSKSVRPFLIIDDYDSGRTLVDSTLYQDGHVVLCKPLAGFIENRYVEAQRKLLKQIKSN